MNINIFQFLKQGTSLSRKSLNSNTQLQKQIIYNKPQPNLDYQQCGRFNQSDSQDQEKSSTNKKQIIQKFNKKNENQNLQFLNKNHIKIQGLDFPKAMSNFTKIIKKYNIKKQLIKGLQQLGFRHPTAVQTQVIPSILEKRNIIVTAPTGTGKTLSYLLPILNNLQQSKKITAIIMAPTQQLASQIIEQLYVLAQQINNISFKCITNISQQQKQKIQNMKSPGFNILITTPMSFLYTFSNGKQKLLKWVQYIVLDQCDKYFQQSFLDQITQFLNIFKNYHPIYALFSATIQHPVEELLKTQIIHDCLRIQVGGKNRVLDKITQSIQYCTNQYGKIVYIKNLILEGGFIPPAIIFVQEKSRAKQLYYELKKILKATIGGKEKIQILSSQKSKQQRQQIINNFDKGQFWALITTDIIARGIDFKNTNLVINYDFPNSMLTYIHRVGRTGRAQRTGNAITLFTDQDKPVVRSLANLLKVSGCPVPQWICSIRKAHKKVIKKLQKYPVKRTPVGHSSGKEKGWQKQLQKLQSKWVKLKRRQQRKFQNKQAQNNNNQDDGWIQVQEQN